MSANDFAELEQLLKDSPYFQSGHTVLAKGSRLLKKQSAGQDTKRAAMYATNRDIFKKYLMGQAKPQAAPAKTAEPQVQKRTQQKPQDTQAPNLLSKSDQEKLIAEIYDNLDKWKSSRDQYLEYDKAHPEEIVILPVDKEAEPAQSPVAKEEPTPPVDTVQELKNQIVEEVEAEDKKEVSDDPVVSEKEPIQSPDTENVSDAIGEAPIPTEEIMGIAEEIKNEVAREEELEANKTVDEPTAVEPEDKSDGPEVESIENMEVPSIYNFSSAPVPEAPPEEIESTSPIVEPEDLVSSEELSSIVDEETEEPATEIKKDKDAPDIEPLDENMDLGDINIEDDIQEITPQAEVKEEDTEPEIEEVLEVDHEQEAKAPEKDSPEIESVDEIDLADLNLPGMDALAEAAKSEESVESPTDPEIEPQVTEVEAEPEVEVEPEAIEEIEEDEDDEDEDDIRAEEPVDEEIKLDIQIDKDKSTEETEAELSKLDAEKQELKLQPGQFNRSKKFRVSVLTKPIKFKKQGETVQSLSAESRREKAAKAEDVKEKISKLIDDQGSKSTTAKKKTAAKATTKKAAPKKTAEKKTTTTAKKKTESTTTKKTATSKTSTKKAAAETKKAASTKKTTKKSAASKASAKKTTTPKKATTKKASTTSKKKGTDGSVSEKKKP